MCKDSASLRTPPPKPSSASTGDDAAAAVTTPQLRPAPVLPATPTRETIDLTNTAQTPADPRSEASASSQSSLRGTSTPTMVAATPQRRSLFAGRRRATPVLGKRSAASTLSSVELQPNLAPDASTTAVLQGTATVEPTSTVTQNGVRTPSLKSCHKSGPDDSKLKRESLEQLKQLQRKLAGMSSALDTIETSRLEGAETDQFDSARSADLSRNTADTNPSAAFKPTKSVEPEAISSGSAAVFSVEPSSETDTAEADAPISNEAELHVSVINSTPNALAELQANTAVAHKQSETPVNLQSRVDSESNPHLESDMENLRESDSDKHAATAGGSRADSPVQSESEFEMDRKDGSACSDENEISTSAVQERTMQPEEKDPKELDCKLLGVKLTNEAPCVLPEGWQIGKLDGGQTFYFRSEDPATIFRRPPWDSEPDSGSKLHTNLPKSSPLQGISDCSSHGLDADNQDNEKQTLESPASNLTVTALDEHNAELEPEPSLVDLSDEEDEETEEPEPELQASDADEDDDVASANVASGVKTVHYQTLNSELVVANVARLQTCIRGWLARRVVRQLLQVLKLKSPMPETSIDRSGPSSDAPLQALHAQAVSSWEARKLAARNYYSQLPHAQTPGTVWRPPPCSHAFYSERSVTQTEARQEQAHKRWIAKQQTAVWRNERR
eukprot:SAG31_NODE_736_length_12477_cov_60.959363_5_plen_674_part_00